MGDRGNRELLGRQHVVRLHDPGRVVWQFDGVLTVKIRVWRRERKLLRRENIVGRICAWASLGRRTVGHGGSVANLAQVGQLMKDIELAPLTHTPKAKI